MENIKLLFPDACWRPDIISGALFLYFHGEQLVFPLHSSASTFLAGGDPFEFFKFAEDRAPKWLPALSVFGQMWRRYRGSLQRTSEILSPFRESRFKGTSNNDGFRRVTTPVWIDSRL
jgi:hypothetical protein